MGPALPTWSTTVALGIHSLSSPRRLQVSRSHCLLLVGASGFLPRCRTPRTNHINRRSGVFSKTSYRHANSRNDSTGPSLLRPPESSSSLSCLIIYRVRSWTNLHTTYWQSDDHYSLYSNWTHPTWVSHFLSRLLVAFPWEEPNFSPLSHASRVRCFPFLDPSPIRSLSHFVVSSCSGLGVSAISLTIPTQSTHFHPSFVNNLSHHTPPFADASCESNLFLRGVTDSQ